MTDDQSAARPTDELMARAAALASYRASFRRDVRNAALAGASIIAATWGSLAWIVRGETAKLEEIRKTNVDLTNTKKILDGDIEKKKRLLADADRALNEKNARLAATSDELNARVVSTDKVIRWDKGTLWTETTDSAQCRPGDFETPSAKKAQAECAESARTSRQFYRGQLTDGPVVYSWPQAPGNSPDCACLMDSTGQRLVAAPPKAKPSPQPPPAAVPAPTISTAPAVAKTRVHIQAPPGASAVVSKLRQQLPAADFTVTSEEATTIAADAIQLYPECGPNPPDPARVSGVRAALAIASLMNVEEPQACPKDVAEDILIVVPPTHVQSVTVDECWEWESQFGAWQKATGNKRKNLFSEADHRCQFTLVFHAGNDTAGCVLSDELAGGDAHRACVASFPLVLSEDTVRVCENDKAPATECNEKDNTAGDGTGDDLLTCTWSGGNAICTQKSGDVDFRKIHFTVIQP